MNTRNEEYRYKELADFLKTRRNRILPTQVGIKPSKRRRTSGLRREEVAQLAGISVTWYTWLEQGREIQVSAQVIESLCRVLLLDQHERNHFYHLANQKLPVEITEYKGSISSVLQHMLDSMELSPSLIIDQRWNVIGWNKAACLVLGEFSNMNARERNIVWAMFTDIRYRRLFVEWESHAKSLVARFRGAFGKYIEDPWLSQFISELMDESDDFKQWWTFHEIQSSDEVIKRLHHDACGYLDFEVAKFDVADNSGLRLIVHTPIKGTKTKECMKVLLNNR